MCVKSELWLCGFGIVIAILLRSCTTLHPYSGQATPPMYGDYEAQRHWMEITVNLPINQWYHNGTKNDLLYWGLDYPPLTAYHSYVCGLIANLINPDFVALGESRGHESEQHKLFMRNTVLIADILLFVPAICWYFYVTKNSSSEQKRMSPHLSIILALLYPGIILIDHGHFQYNCISLAFLVYAIIFLHLNRTVLSAVTFCLALNYKQMELYHSIPFFVYLLSDCVPKPGGTIRMGLIKFSTISLAVIVSFLVIWSPFLTSFEGIAQVVHRLFPFARGIFEDKVANVWCALNVFYKFKQHHASVMVRYCTVATLMAVLPSSIDLFLRPNLKKFVPALINSSLAFFLFSYQVHEKSILLAAVPAMLYLPNSPVVCFWFLIISTVSMVPLFMKDRLVVAFIALTAFYMASFQISLRHNFKAVKSKKNNDPFYKQLLIVLLNIEYRGFNNQEISKLSPTNFYKNVPVVLTTLKYVTLLISLIGCGILVVLTLVLNPPDAYPDLFPLLISVYSCIHFVIFFVYFNIEQLKMPQCYVKLKNQ